MDFTQDWFTSNIANFEHAKKVMTDNKSILEIGCFEGRATCWMLENMLADDGKIYCIDTFKGGVEHSDLDLSRLRDVFEENISACAKPKQEVKILENLSFKSLAMLIMAELEFDFIYVDGSHELLDVLTDSVMAFRLLKPGGVMLFDDYGGGQDVRKAVDLFLLSCGKLCTVLCCNYQLAIQKV